MIIIDRVNDNETVWTCLYPCYLYNNFFYLFVCFFRIYHCVCKFDENKNKNLLKKKIMVPILNLEELQLQC